MTTIDLDSTLRDFASDQLERQIPALDQLCQLVNDLVKLAVYKLETGPERFLIAERLHNLGGTAIVPLESLLMRTDNPEVRILASLVLMQVGSQTGLPWLLQGILEDRNYATLIVRHVAEHKVSAAADKIVARLRVSDATTDLDLVVASLEALEKLNVDVPQDLLVNFAAPAMPWQVRTLAERLNSKQPTVDN